MLTRDFLAGCVRSFPEKTAYAEADRARTWREVEERARRLAAVWLKLGVRQGDVVAILALDRIELVEHFCACMIAGVVRVGINWRYAPVEMAHIIRDSNAKLIIVDSACAASLADHTTAFHAEGRTLLGFGSGHSLEHDYEQSLADTPPLALLPEISETDIAAITYTTGTTGMPKGALWSQVTVREGLVRMVAAMNLVNEDVWLTPAPGAGAPILFMHFGLINGMTTILRSTFDVAHYLQDVETFQVTKTLVIPTMLRRLIEQYRQSPCNVASLRLICYGSMPAPVALLREAAEVFPSAGFLQLYGGTETAGGPVTILYPSDHAAALQGDAELLKSCGRVTPHLRVEVRSDRGDVLGPNQVGEVWIAGDTIMLGYHQLPEETAESLRHGWVTMGDLGYVDERGYLFLVERRKFMVISGGYNVYPVVVENVLAQHPAVREVAVVGAPHPEWGEAVVAAISLKPIGKASEQEMIEFCRGKLGLWEVPKAVVFLAELPKGSTGKIQKKQLQEMLKSEEVSLPWKVIQA